MADYRPLKLGRFCNACAKLGVDGNVPSGKQNWQGLPFQVARGRKCLLGFGEKLRTAPLAVPIGRKAHSIVFAHRLLDSKIFEGDPVGRVVAEYIFAYADGGEERVPIRERFELAGVPFQKQRGFLVNLRVLCH